MSTLYAMLDILDISSNLSDMEELNDQTQYKMIPALTVNAPLNLDSRRSSYNSQSDQE